MERPGAAALDRGLARLGLEPAGAARERLLEYVALLERWNRAFNLTAVRGADAIVERHLLESLAILGHVRGPLLLDVGTGAGVPGLVLAIARPELRCTLLDGNGKKIRFCAQAAIELGLDNVETVHRRLETLAPGAAYDTVTSRATMEITALWALARPLLAPGGVLIALGAAADAATLAGLDPRPRRVEVLAGDRARERAAVLVEGR